MQQHGRHTTILGSNTMAQSARPAAWSLHRPSAHQLDGRLRRDWPQPIHMHIHTLGQISRGKLTYAVRYHQIKQSCRRSIPVQMAPHSLYPTANHNAAASSSHGQSDRTLTHQHRSRIKGHEISASAPRTAHATTQRRVARRRTSRGRSSVNKLATRCRATSARPDRRIAAFGRGCRGAKDGRTTEIWGGCSSKVGPSGRPCGVWTRNPPTPHLALPRILLQPQFTSHDSGCFV